MLELRRLPRWMAPHRDFGDISMAGCSLSGWVGVLVFVFFRQFNAIGPVCLYICSTSWPRGYPGFSGV